MKSTTASKIFYVQKFQAHHFGDWVNHTKVGVLVDEHSEKYCYPLIQNVLPTDHFLIRIKSGEENKNIETCLNIWQQLTEFEFDRKSLLINLGGGVIGDMGGFCAATFKRGIGFIHVPTTLLAQVDASVGGKLGIDFQDFKNHIGIFEFPERVLICTEFLKTLSERQMRAGFAEVIKHCLIADAKEWKKIIAQPFLQQNWYNVVMHSISIKSEIIQNDPLETGLRKVLNFGHTIGHAVESYCLKNGKSILHGEAVAIGMVCESYIAHQKNLLSRSELEEIYTFILNIFGKFSFAELDIKEIISLTTQDKKNEGNRINCTLLNGIGNAVYNIRIIPPEVEASIYFYASL